MSLPLLFDRSWLQSTHTERRRGLDLLVERSRSPLHVVCSTADPLPSSYLGRPLCRFEIGEGGLDECAAALASHHEPLEVLLPHVSDVLKMAAMLLRARGSLDGWRLSSWPSSATDPGKMRQVHHHTSGQRKASGVPWAMPTGIHDPWLVGLTIVGDDDLKAKDLSVLGGYFKSPVCRVDEVWLFHFQGEAQTVGALKKRKPWKTPSREFEVPVERGSRQYEGFPVEQLRAALQQAIAQVPGGRAPEFVINFCRGRDPIKLALLELAVDGHLPGSWIVPDPHQRDRPDRARLLDPTRLPRLASVLERDRLHKIDAEMNAHTDETHSIPLLEARRKAWNASQGDLDALSPVLLLGQTGTGKSHLAQAMADLRETTKSRKSRFQSINCAHFAGNPDLLLSALFGHRKGAFSGADRDREGAFRAADGGVLFLDEVGEMPLSAQSMLLKALDRPGETGKWEFSPVGTDNKECSSFLLVCGTNQDLDMAVSEGRFRRDLLERIRHRTIALPTLAERLKGDPSGREGLRMLASIWGVSAPRVLASAREALSRLLVTHDWPGNHREFHRWARRLRELSVSGMIGEDQIRASRDVLDRPSRTGLVSQKCQALDQVSDKSEILRIAGTNNAAIYWLAVGAGLEPQGQSNPSMRGRLLRKTWETDGL